MPRKRMIDPNIWQSEDFSKLSTLAKIVFIGMFSNADDYGYGRAKAAYLKSVIFPYDEHMRVSDVDKTLNEIASNMSVTFYTHGGNEYYSLTNWEKWQRVDRPTESQIPPFKEDAIVIRRAFDESSTSPRRSFAPSIEEVSIREVKRDIYGDLEAFFEQLWTLYPRKEGKGNVSKKQKKILFEIGLEQMKRAIRRYQTELERNQTEKKYIKHGGTFFNTGYVDYLDENYKEEGNGGADRSASEENQGTWNGYDLKLE